MAANSNYSIDISRMKGTRVPAKPRRIFVKGVVAAVLIEIVDRPGYYEVTDKRTGRPTKIRNSAMAHWVLKVGQVVTLTSGKTMLLDEGAEVWTTWSKYQRNGRWYYWRNYDSSIDLARCVSEGTPLDYWRDDDGHYHLELAEDEDMDGVVDVFDDGYDDEPMTEIPMSDDVVMPWEQ